MGLQKGLGGKARQTEKKSDNKTQSSEKKTGMTTQKIHRQLATLLTAPENAPTNEHAKDNDEQTDTGCLVVARPLSLYLSFGCMGVRRIHTQAQHHVGC